MDAEETVNLLTYAYWRGDIAVEVADTLCEKASAGVECNVILDAVGAAKMDRKLVGEDARRGRAGLLLPAAEAVRGQAAPAPHAPEAADRGRAGSASPAGSGSPRSGPATPRTRPLARHARSRARPRRARPAGRVRRELARVHGRRARRRPLPARTSRRSRTAAPMQVMRSSATIGDTNAEALVFLALAAAKRSIELTSAYFVPRPAFTDALVEAAERGVDLRILVPGSHIDKEFVRTAGPRRVRRPARARASRSTSTARRCCTRRRSRSTAPGHRSAP